MRKNVLLCFYIVLVVLNVNAADGVTQDIGKICSFKFPDEPQISEVEGVKNFLYSTNSCSYLVQVRPVTKTGVIRDSATLIAFYEGTVKGILRRYDGSMLSEKQIRINGLMGEELEYIWADQNRQPVSVCSRILMLRGHLIVYTFSAPYSRFSALKHTRDDFFASLEIYDHKISDGSKSASDTKITANDTAGLATPIFDSVTARLHVAPIHRELVKANTLRFAISFVACILLLLGALFILVRFRKRNKAGK